VICSAKVSFIAIVSLIGTCQLCSKFYILCYSHAQIVFHDYLCHNSQEFNSFRCVISFSEDFKESFIVIKLCIHCVYVLLYWLFVVWFCSCMMCVIFVGKQLVQTSVFNFM